MGFSNIVGLRCNPGVAYVNIFYIGSFNSSMWVLPKFVLIYGFKMQVFYLMYIGTIGMLYHDMGIIMRILIHNIDFKRVMYVLHFGFLSNVHRIINYLGAAICPISFNHGKGSKVPFLKQGLGVEV